MNTQQFFISYSRQQLYYTEDMVHILQESGINIWFDLQQLQPGCNWVNEIQNGLVGSDALILVASQSALASPYVATEWQHALQNNKPIYIIVFEPCDFSATSGANTDNSATLQVLYEKADAVIDGRRNFKAAVQSLLSSLQTEAKSKQTVPASTRFNRILGAPLAVQFVAGLLLIFALATTYISLRYFTIFIPMLLVGLFSVGAFLWQFWAFSQRTSIAGTRIGMLVGFFLSAIMTPLLAPLALIGVYLVFRSGDLHRWSPTGQGLRRRGQITRERHRGGRRSVFILAFATLVTIIDPLVAIFFVIPVGIVAIIRQRINKRPGELMGQPLTYGLYAAEQDSRIADDIRGAMAYAHHREITTLEPINYGIVVLTDYAEPPPVTAMGNTPVIVVVGSSLSDTSRFADWQRYQWVDYRRQEPEVLVAMARDLSKRQGTNSFATRILPRDFQQTILPFRVSFYLLIQLFALNLSVFQLTRTLITADKIDPLFVTFFVLTIGVSLYLFNSIQARGITLGKLLLANIGLGLFTQLALIATKTIVFDLPWSLVAMIVGFLIGYIIIRLTSGTILYWWLPRKSARQTIFSMRPALFIRNTVLVIVTMLFTFSLFGPAIPYLTDTPLEGHAQEEVTINNDLTVRTPDTWRKVPAFDGDYSSSIEYVPLAKSLIDMDNPMSRFAGQQVNNYFYSALRGQTLTTILLDAVGESIGDVFDEINSNLAGSNTRVPWEGSDFGHPVASWVYTPNEDEVLTLTIWEYRAPFSGYSANEPVGYVLDVAEGGTNTSRYRNIRGDGYAFVITDDSTDDIHYLHIINRSGIDYFMVARSNNSRLISEAQPIIDAIAASAQ